MSSPSKMSGKSSRSNSPNGSPGECDETPDSVPSAGTLAPNSGVFDALVVGKKKDNPTTTGSEKFPSTLHKILSEEGNSDIISWLPSGKAFIVTNKKRFETEILPRYFKKQTRYTSFTRKLIRWNFMRQSSGPCMGAYHHKFFLKDKPSLCLLISCQGALSRDKLRAAETLFGPGVVSAAGRDQIPLPPPERLFARNLEPSRAAALSHPLYDAANHRIESSFLALSEQDRMGQLQGGRSLQLQNNPIDALGAVDQSYAQDSIGLSANAGLQYQILNSAKRGLVPLPPPRPTFTGLNMETRPELALAERLLPPRAGGNGLREASLATNGYLPPPPSQERISDLALLSRYLTPEERMLIHARATSQHGYY